MGAAGNSYTYARGRKMKRKSDSVLRDLFAVMTVNEAARRFAVHRNTVLAACDAGKFDFRKSEGTYLIRTESLIAYFGKPIDSADMESVELTLPMFRHVA
jgi:excisionase family DNA binding protein